jgi:plasmid stability protein
MRTTLNIDDHLYREVKVRAARENRTVTELVETALRGFLHGAPNEVDSAGVRSSKTNRFPTIKARPLQKDRRRVLSVDEVGERVKEAELDFDVERHKKIFGH